MNTFLVGVLVVSAAVPLLVAESDLDPAIQRDFICSFVAGIGGSVACCCIWPPKSSGGEGIRELARMLASNMLIATLFGPGFSFWIAGVFKLKYSPHVIVPASGALALGGVALIRTAGPRIVSMLASVIPAMIVRIVTGKDVPPEDKPPGVS